MANVSVIIPTWNRANTIEKAVRSALNQTMTVLEVLVCDDGSTDNTKDVVASIEDPRLRWIEGGRGGRPAIPRNRGIKQIKGDWVAFLDSDDEWLPEKLEKQLALAEKLSCKAVCTNAYRLIPEKDIEGNLLSWHKERITFDDLLLDNQVICSSTLIHRSVLSKMDGFPESSDLRGIEDYAFWLRAATLTAFGFINEPLLTYIDDPVTSVRGEVTTNAFEQKRYVFNDYLKWVESQCIADEYRNKVKSQLSNISWQARKTKVINFARSVKRLIIK